MGITQSLQGSPASIDINPRDTEKDITAEYELVEVVQTEEGLRNIEEDKKNRVSLVEMGWPLIVHSIQHSLLNLVTLAFKSHRRIRKLFDKIRDISIDESDTLQEVACKWWGSMKFGWVSMRRKSWQLLVISWRRSWGDGVLEMGMLKGEWDNK